MRRCYFETLHNKCIFYSNHTMIMINNLHYIIFVTQSLSGLFLYLFLRKRSRMFCIIFPWTRQLNVRHGLITKVRLNDRMHIYPQALNLVVAWVYAAMFVGCLNTKYMHWRVYNSKSLFYQNALIKPDKFSSSKQRTVLSLWNGGCVNKSLMSKREKVQMDKVVAHFYTQKMCIFLFVQENVERNIHSDECLALSWTTRK